MSNCLADKDFQGGGKPAFPVKHGSAAKQHVSIRRAVEFIDENGGGPWRAATYVRAIKSMVPPSLPPPPRLENGEKHRRPSRSRTALVVHFSCEVARRGEAGSEIRPARRLLFEISSLQPTIVDLRRLQPKVVFIRIGIAISSRQRPEITGFSSIKGLSAFGPIVPRMATLASENQKNPRRYCLRIAT
jgi:hypothetical protein